MKKQKTTLKFICLWSMAVLLSSAGLCQAADTNASDASDSKQNLAELAKKLNNPVSDVWGLEFEFDWVSQSGDITNDSSKSGFIGLFEPMMPVPLTEDWRLIARPVIPYLNLNIPHPEQNGFVGYEGTSGIGDIILPMMVSPIKSDSLTWAFGPTFSFPTSSDDTLGSEKWSAGPAGALIYKSDSTTLGIFGQYWWDFAGPSDTPDVSNAQIMYFAWYMLPFEGHWQIGLNPTITYNSEADSGDQWNVPIGVAIGKMLKIGKLPIKIMAGVDYSVVQEDSYGDEWKFKLMIIPVLPSLIKNALF